MLIDKSSPIYSLAKICWIALMAALICLGAIIHVFIGPVPVTFQEVFVTLSGLILGPIAGPLSVILYIFAGLAGFPVFAGGRGGFAYIFGPTGGYLIGFVFLSFFAGWGKNLFKNLEKEHLKFIFISFFCFCGLFAVYLYGSIWLSKILKISMKEAISVGVLPFLPFSIIKIPATVLIWRLWLRFKPSFL